MGSLYSALFIFFFMFAMIAYFNVVTGVFAEKAMSLATPSEQEVRTKRHAKQISDASELISLLKHILHVEGTADLTMASLDKFIAHPEGLAFFEGRGMNATSARHFLQVLVNLGGQDRIDVTTFISSCVKLDGPATYMDLHVMHVELKSTQMSLHKLHRELRNLKGPSSKTQAVLSEFASTRVQPETPLSREWSDPTGNFQVDVSSPPVSFQRESSANRQATQIESLFQREHSGNVQLLSRQGSGSNFAIPTLHAQPVPGIDSADLHQQARRMLPETPTTPHQTMYPTTPQRAPYKASVKEVAGADCTYHAV